jgi:hypothetical protein
VREENTTTIRAGKSTFDKARIEIVLIEVWGG